MKIISIIIFSFVAMLSCAANENAISKARTHLQASILSDTKTLAQTYAEKVTILSGHEYLSDEFKIAKAEGKQSSIVVDRSTLINSINAYIKAFVPVDTSAKKPDAKAVEKSVSSLAFELITPKSGKYGFSNEKEKPNKWTLNIAEGDLLVKIDPEKSNHPVLQLRKVEGSWKVVGEFLH